MASFQERLQELSEQATSQRNHSDLDLSKFREGLDFFQELDVVSTLSAAEKVAREILGYPTHTQEISTGAKIFKTSYRDSWGSHPLLYASVSAGVEYSNNPHFPRFRIYTAYRFVGENRFFMGSSKIWNTPEEKLHLIDYDRQFTKSIDWTPKKFEDRVFDMLKRSIVSGFS